MTESGEKDVQIKINPLDDVDYRSKWPGWAIVESEPAIFDSLLHKIGVRDVCVEEVYSLDADNLQSLSPIYGLIFLFRWKTEHMSDAVETKTTSGIWFANQVIDNACASLALLNIVFNLEEVEIGEQLSTFREFTKDFSPALRGLALTNFDHLRRLHNTFARKSDMAASDLTLMQNMRSRKKLTFEDEDEDCFHFISYIYKDGHVWELDGLRQAPVCLNECSKDTWTYVVAPLIQERMQSYAANEIRFNLLALCQDRELFLRERLHQLEADLELAKMAEAHHTMPHLIEQIELVRQTLHEHQSEATEHKMDAERRRHDYANFAKRMLEILIEKNVVRQVLDS